MINQLGMNSHVQLNGYVPYDVLLRKISESDIVALPSIYEVGAFIAALEAMALKKAVVAFDYPFTRQLLSDGNTGLLAKGEDAKDLARCINLFAEDKNLRRQMGNNAFEHIQKNHNWAILVNRYLEIYQQLTECC
jgi:glycosyltransferase involved in cell wall biosynthesis